jgi:hypothetical protein
MSRGDVPSLSQIQSPLLTAAPSMVTCYVECEMDSEVAAALELPRELAVVQVNTEYSMPFHLVKIVQ